MAKKPPPRPEHKWMSGEVDRLLQQLGPDTRTARPAGARPASARPAGARPATTRPGTTRPHPRPGSRPAPTARQLPVRLPSPLGVWARVALGVSLTLALTQWPYAYCGVPLVAYLAATVTVLVAGAWAAHAAWRRRMGRPHLVALTFIFAAAMLAAVHVLPPLGNPSVATIWRCVG